MNPFSARHKTQGIMTQNPCFMKQTAGVCLQNTYDYSPFGVSLDGRTVEGDFYRRGFNGLEKDYEVKGAGNSYDFGARMYDPRVGRWLTIDPECKIYPSQSSYTFVLNNPIVFIDPDGRKVEIYDKDGNKVATLSNSGIVIEKGMENSYILKSYLESKEYLQRKDQDILCEIENSDKLLSIVESEDPNSSALFSPNWLSIEYSGRDSNQDGSVSGFEIEKAVFNSKFVGIIIWNPSQGAIDAENNYHSPSLVLAHEIKHAHNCITNLLNFLIRSSLKTLSSSLGGNDNLEETDANDYGDEVSKNLGNGDGGNGVDKKRTSHGYKKFFKAKSVTSNEDTENE